MNFNSCTQVRGWFSAYIDGAVSGQQMLAISGHINGNEGSDGCMDCARELSAWRTMQSAVASVGRAKAPPDLALKLRIAISHENARRNIRLMDRLERVWDNVVRPRMLQVSAGFAGSLVLGAVVLLLGVVAAPQPVMANDEPLGAITAPHFLYSSSSTGDLLQTHGIPIVAEALIDSSGRVYDFTIVSGPKDDAVRTRVADQLLGSVYQPASAFGVPVRGRVLLTFAGISVRG